MPRNLRRFKIAVTVFLVLFAHQAVASESDRASFEPARTHAVIVGVLRWQSPAISTFSSENRKDQQLYDTLAERGVPKENMALLLDDEATLEGIRNALREVSSKAKDGDTLIFYYAGHGTSVDGNATLYNYDVDPAKKADTSLTSTEIASILKNKFRGKRVLMFADCCFSGALAGAAEELSNQGIEAATITSANASITSTSNWTFTHMLVEILRGNPDSDLNNDGVITLAEAAQETSDAMKYRENQPSGYSRFGLPEDYCLSVATKKRADATLPAPYKLFEYVQIRRNDHWIPARLVDYRDGSYSAEVQHYATREIVAVSGDSLRKYQKISRPRPKRLELRKALAKARVEGKYTELLEIFEAESDYRAYSTFHDFGHYPATSYAGQSDLPDGYWVYVYPNWYIWKNKVR
jgi:caspase domain-containing protein